jgi:hypothetical protein
MNIATSNLNSAKAPAKFGGRPPLGRSRAIEPAPSKGVAGQQLAAVMAPPLRDLPGIQQTHGNQAVLRMLDKSDKSHGDPDRKCTCGGGASCAECAGSAAPLNRAAAKTAKPPGVAAVGK